MAQRIAILVPWRDSGDARRKYLWRYVQTHFGQYKQEMTNWKMAAWPIIFCDAQQ